MRNSTNFAFSLESSWTKWCAVFGGNLPLSPIFADNGRRISAQRKGNRRRVKEIGGSCHHVQDRNPSKQVVKTFFQTHIHTDRYDMLCIEGISMALRQYLGKQDIPQFITTPFVHKLTVSPEVRNELSPLFFFLTPERNRLHQFDPFLLLPSFAELLSRRRDTTASLISKINCTSILPGLASRRHGCFFVAQSQSRKLSQKENSRGNWDARFGFP